MSLLIKEKNSPALEKTGTQTVQIAAPNLKVAEFKLTGTAPYVQLRFSEKAMNAMAAKMKAGSQAKGKKIRESRDFDDDFIQAQHISTEGWIGIPAGSIRAAMVSACRLVNFKMTLAKLSIFVEADGYDKVDAVPLIKIEGNPVKHTMAVRNATGVADLRCRPMWKVWGAKLRIRYDQDQFSLVDITNLLMRVGMQVGLGEGRPDSRESCGLGWGTFDISTKD